MLKHSSTVTQHYSRCGYVILPYQLHSSLLNELQSALRELQNEAENNTNTRYTKQYDLDQKGRLCKIKRPHQWSHVFKKLLYNPSITNTVNHLLNDPSTSPSAERPMDPQTCGIRYQGFKLNIKPPCDGPSIVLHQDFAYYPHTNDNLCTVSIPLSDLCLDSGTLLFLPGSHLGPIYSHHLNGEFVGGIHDLD
eukprot:767484_1